MVRSPRPSASASWRQFSLTALAIALAEEANVTLIGFARPEGHSIYAHARRVRPDPLLTKSAAR
jgi:FdhD protein